MNRNDPRFWMVGAVAGISGLLLFLIIHHLWILPIWFVLPLGAPVAALGGITIEGAYREIAHRFPPRWWHGLAVAGGVAVMLLPSLLIAELRLPFYHVTPSGAILALITVPEIVLRFVTDLLLPTMLVGALLGGWLGKSRRAALLSALAGFMIALGPGHNIPFLGRTAGVGKQVVILSIVILISAVILVEGHRRLMGKHVLAEGR